MNSRWMALMLLALTVAAPACRNSKAKEQLPPPSGPGAAPVASIPVIASAAPARFGEAVELLVVTGTAQPVREAKLGPKSSGVLAAMLVEEGDQVKKGQLLFRLEAANQSLAVSQAEAALSSALVAQNAAQTELQRIRALHERGSIAPATYDQVKAQYDGAQAAVKQAKAAVARAKQATADTAVYSPIAGVVSKRLASVGETVTMMPPTVVLVVQDISELEVRGRVPETLLKKLRPGSPVRVRFPAVDVERTVEIKRINPSVDTFTRTIEVVALIPNQDRLLKAGMLVELDFAPAAGSPSPAAAASTTAEAMAGKP
jgi:RND family efflux transporter MFP subunit